jgi:hypothetical protein
VRYYYFYFTECRGRTGTVPVLESGDVTGDFDSGFVVSGVCRGICFSWKAEEVVK